MDTHDHRSQTFPHGISKQQFLEFFSKYEHGSRDEDVVVLRTLEEAASTQVEQRVARYLLRQHARRADAAIRVSQAEIAGELGTAREVVFRALRSVAAARLIESGRLRIRILDVDGLTRLSRAPIRRVRGATRAEP